VIEAFIYEFEKHYHFQLIALTLQVGNVHSPENYANLPEMYREEDIRCDRFNKNWMIQ